MPTKKKPVRKTRSTSSQRISEKALSKAYETELSYETRVVIVILLLLFVYPIGLIFMWAWMRNWALWAKLLITLPFLLGLFAFFGLFLLIGSLLTRNHMDNAYPQYPYPTRQENRVATPAPTGTVFTPTQQKVTF